jgi:sugar O-acyltransferase (sialic acid O-acetyltransferase NeuD family)
VTTEKVGRLALLGAGGHGRVVAELAAATGWTVVGFVDPALVPGAAVLGAPALPDDLSRLRAADVTALASVGDNAARWREHQRIAAAGLTPPALIHPRAIVSPSATIGPGAVVMAGAVVQAGARIGPAAVVNSGACVEHDCDIGAGALIGPGAALAGGATVGALALVGVGACVAPGVRIGARALVTAGAAATRAVPDDGVLRRDGAAPGVGS